MNENQFMIGNYVLIDGKLDRLGRIEGNGYVGDNYGHGVHDSQIELIPLTADWLAEFGATVWKKMKHRIIWKVGQILIGSTGSVKNGVDLVFDGGTVTKYPIKYVHTLQNIHLLISGKELEMTTQ